MSHDRLLKDGLPGGAKKGFQHVGSNQTHFEAALGQHNTVGPATLILIRKVRFDKERMHFVNVGVISSKLA
jgi:hypothetical protein